MTGKVVAVACNPSIDKTIAIEKLVPYELNRVLSSRIDPGGKGINVAKVLKNFQVDVTVTGFIAGSQGSLLEDFLKKAEIDCDFLQIPGETRTNLKIVDQSVNKTTEINEAGCCVDADALADFKRKLAELVRQASVVVLSGSLPPGLPEDFYAQCIRAAKKAGVKTLLDADGSALFEGMKAVPFAVKPNIHELEAYCGRRFRSVGEVADAARALVSEGIEIVIVSMGADGSIAVDKNEAFQAVPWNMKAQSTVGAGDSMVGALARSILERHSLSEIARMTTAAGTVTASKAGTEICTLGETLSSIENVTVTRI
ncbi:MAG: 1-phosphofructokinase [Clostridiales bacterium]|nr:1-phosphofructokinase [Clostridiales bacterium]